jgi:hypothetical protein
MTITAELLYQLANELNYDVYQIAEHLKIDYKLVRSYFRKYNLTLNELKHSGINQTYVIPDKSTLLSSLSIAAHINYLCEGWHTEKTNRLAFYNQDENLVKFFSKCIHKIYQYDMPVVINIMYNKNCVKSKEKTSYYENIFKDTSKYKIGFSNDPTRLNPIILARCGNKSMARLFIDNAYKILNEI